MPNCAYQHCVSMERFNDAHHNVVTTTTITDKSRYRILQVHVSLKTDRQLNQTNGVDKSKLMERMDNCVPRLRLTLIGSNALVCWLVTMAHVSSIYMALANETSFNHIHTNHHHAHHTQLISDPVLNRRHYFSHNPDIYSQNHVLPFAINCSVIPHQPSYIITTDLVPNSVSVLNPPSSATNLDSSQSSSPFKSSMNSINSNSMFKHTRSILSTNSYTVINNGSTVQNQSLIQNKLLSPSESTLNTINQTRNGTSKTDFYNSSWNIHLLWYSLFGVMISVGVIANCLIIATIISHKTLHNITNLYLLNLTASDLVSLLFNAIFNTIFMLNGHWPFGKVCQTI